MALKTSFQKLVLLICVLFTLSSCNETTKSNVAVVRVALDSAAISKVATAETSVEAAVALPELTIVDQEEDADQLLMSLDTILFGKFPADTGLIIKKAPLDFTTYPGAKDFITRIKEGYEASPPSFAGFYTTVTFGCGAGCIMGFMIDDRNGAIYDLPLGEENMCVYSLDRSVYEYNSRLYISAICKESQDSKTIYYQAFLWNEQKKVFKEIKGKDFVKRG